MSMKSPGFRSAAQPFDMKERPVSLAAIFLVNTESGYPIMISSRNKVKTSAASEVICIC